MADRRRDARARRLGLDFGDRREGRRGRGFNEEQQAVLHKDGPGSEISYRLAWARTYLKGMGLAENSRRGVWSLNERGRSVEESEIEPLRHVFLRKHRERKKAEKAVDSPPNSDDNESDELSWQDDLLEALLKMDPDAFERLCQLLLRNAGFVRTQVTGRSGDGGIDGLGTYRLSLVSFQVFFQAKRWRNSVGSKEVRDFRGAMSGRGEKGLLITTATFTAEAKAEASRDGAPPWISSTARLFARYSSSTGSASRSRSGS